MGPGELAAGLEVMIFVIIVLLKHGLGENSGPEELLPVAVRLLVLGSRLRQSLAQAQASYVAGLAQAQACLLVSYTPLAR